MGDATNMRTPYAFVLRNSGGERERTAKETVMVLCALTQTDRRDWLIMLKAHLVRWLVRSFVRPSCARADCRVSE